MGLTLYTESGELLDAGDGGPYQYSPEGYNTGLARNSTPLSQWEGFPGGSYRHLYESQPAVAIAANKLTRQTSRVPLKVYRGDSGSGKERVTDGTLVDAIRSPAKGRGSTHLKQWLMLPALIHGNSAVQKIRRSAGGPIVGFRPLNWRLLTPRWIDNDVEEPIDYWVYDASSGREVIQPDDIIHIAWHPAAGQIGVSPLKQLGTTLRIERAAQRWQESLLNNSARPSGGVTMPEALAGNTEAHKQLRAELRADVADMHQGAWNAGRPILMPPGGKWEAFSYNASEAELIEQRHLGRDEVFGVYEIPLLGDTTTAASIDTQRQMLYSDTCGPWLTLVEETLTAALQDEPSHGGEWLEFDVKEFLRGDPVKEAAAAKTRIASGTLTIDEDRDANNLPRFGGVAAEPLIQANNMSKLEDIAGESQVPNPDPQPPDPNLPPEG